MLFRHNNWENLRSPVLLSAARCGAHTMRQRPGSTLCEGKGHRPLASHLSKTLKMELFV